MRVKMIEAGVYEVHANGFIWHLRKSGPKCWSYWMDCDTDGAGAAGTYADAKQDIAAWAGEFVRIWSYIGPLKAAAAAGQGYNEVDYERLDGHSPASWTDNLLTLLATKVREGRLNIQTSRGFQIEHLPY